MTHHLNWRRIASTVAVALAAAHAHAQQMVLADQSEVAFTTRQMGVPVEGKFRKFSATARIDAAAPHNSSVSISVDMGSIYFPAPEVVQEAKGVDWLDTSKFATAEFQSTSVKPLDARRVEVSGPLTIRGRSKTLVLPVTVTSEGGQTRAAGQFVLQRGDFGIGAGAWADPSLVANDVTVKFHLKFKDH